MKRLFLRVDPTPFMFVSVLLQQEEIGPTVRYDTRKNKQGKPESQVTGRHLSIASRECDTALRNDSTELAAGHKAPFSLISDNFTFTSADICWH
jgi:hypothetical protein